MGWNYRVVEETIEMSDKYAKKGLCQSTEHLYSIYEVYYDEAGKIDGFHAVPTHLDGFSDAAELKYAIKLISEAFEKPILKLRGEELSED